MFKTFVVKKNVKNNLKFEYIQFSNATVIYIYTPSNITYLKTSQIVNSSWFKLLTPRNLAMRITTQLSPNWISNFYMCNKLGVRKVTNKIQSLTKIYFQTISFATAYCSKKYMRMRGVGYKFVLDKSILILEVGYSHRIGTILPTTFNAFFSRKASKMLLQSRQLAFLTLFLAKIRKARMPDIYKGKGIRYRREHRKLKEGKKKKTF